ncbi:hypothetical protein M2480_002325 [Parabacteroides sp. PFB2-12]|uniref:hypothetical protein n=1 Tax=unclassified Parabacteroides TaxID=2649774 RepID=UPI00247442DD|nr:MULTISPECIES: hypothetical protein [unclassified Parabacteroides]MDH6343694.1 hypothetical protein [Parabacteroides sp. PM6-13]MDH6391330.1 hypothetical protein [Parabacteroides sp. PFB2-12]
MNRIWIMMVFALSAFCLNAQQHATYNQKGDEALQQKDYTSARMWYGEGIGYCDIYSIEKLTDIWLEDENMRPSMRNLMTRCLKCLNDKAELNDTTAIKLLVVYHAKGIATPNSDTIAEHWQNKYEELTNPYAIYANNLIAKKPKEPMSFFAGYTYSTEMPVGLTFGGLQEKAGWYVRVRSDLSFRTTDYACKLENDASAIVDPDNNKTYQALDMSNKKTSFAGTAGFIYKFTDWLYASVGVGYGERNLLSPFTMTDNTSGAKEFIWCNNQTYSSKGAVGELDLTLRFNYVYVSVGGHTVNFDYVDLNAGIGLFF